MGLCGDVSDLDQILASKVFCKSAELSSIVSLRELVVTSKDRLHEIFEGIKDADTKKQAGLFSEGCMPVTWRVLGGGGFVTVFSPPCGFLHAGCVVSSKTKELHQELDHLNRRLTRLVESVG